MDQASTSAMSSVNVTDDHELYPPSWIDEEFFTEVLRKCEKTDDILVNEVKLFTATAKGANYGGASFRGSVSYDRENSKGKSKSLIIKTLTEMDDHKNDVFEAEISIYSEAIPKFESEFSKSGESTIFGAEVLYYSLEPRKVIVFEDLRAKGYERLRDRYCNIEEGKAAFLKLAKWHAVSYKLAAEGDTSVTSYKDTFLDLKCIKEIPFIAILVKVLIDQLLELDKFKPFTPKLLEIQEDLLNKSLNSSKISLPQGSEGLFALCHGNFHQTNIMFKHCSSGNIEDVILIGFQESYFGLALLDVLNGLTMISYGDTSSGPEMFHFYSLSFIESLKKLKFQGKIPKVSELFIELSRVQDSITAEVKNIVLGKLVIANLK